jgi:hypothetical protein
MTTFNATGDPYITLPNLASNMTTGNIITGNSFYTKNDPSLNIPGNAVFEGDIIWKGRSLGNMLKTIEDRLAILVPDPEKLEQFEALKKAYEHYKVLEALCQLPKEENQP